MDSEVKTENDFAYQDEVTFGGNVSGVAPLYDPTWDVSVPLFLSVPVYIPEFSEEDFRPEEFRLEEADVLKMPDNKDSTEQGVQTEDWTEEKGINTNEDWISEMCCVEERSAELALQYETLVKQQTSEQTEHARQVEGLEKKRNEKKKQYQNLMDKIESLRVKLQLNSSKTTRKNFSVKLEELTAEKERMVEKKRGLAQELEEAEKKLKTHLEEQNLEKLTWEKELADLCAEKERLGKQIEEANQVAQKDEIAALESQKELVMSEVEEWIADAERYLSFLRLDNPHHHNRQRLEWEKNVAFAHHSLTNLQNKYNENLKLLQSGQMSDSLPAILPPTLPNVPMHNSPTPQAPPPSSAAPPHFYPPHRVSPSPPAVLQHGPHVPTSSNPSRSREPSPHIIVPTIHMSVPKPPVIMPGLYPVTPTKPAPHRHAVATPAANYSGPPLIFTAAAAAAAPHVAGHAAPSAQTVLPNPPPAGKLDKLLERLGTHFPQCTRAQLMTALQQIKTERGTMAGMSMEDLTQQVAQRLHSERLAPGPIGPPSASKVFVAHPGPIQRPPVQPTLPAHPHAQAPGAQAYQPHAPQTSAPAMRKLCLMCQNHVEPGTQYKTNCSHTLHKECISIWHKSSKNNTCPFCPSK